MVDERSLMELAAALGGIGGAAAGRIEESIHPVNRFLNWKASIPVFMAAGVLYAFRAKKLAAGLAGFGAGIAVNDALGLLMQTGTPWERKDLFFAGTSRKIKIPLWSQGRTLEESMVEPYIVDAVWRGRLDPRVRSYVFHLLDERNLDGRQYIEVAKALQEDQQRKFKYAHDPARTEIFQEAGKSLELHRGDCDDAAILMASKLMAIGIPAKLIILSFDRDFNPEKSRYGHILTAARINGKDYWLETIQQDPPAPFDYRPFHTGRIEFELVSPTKVKKKIVYGTELVSDSIVGLANLANANEDLTLGVI